MGRRKNAEKYSSGDEKSIDNGQNFKQNSRFAEKPLQRNAANARERTRMRTLSKAFSRLKTTLPWVPADTKLSKLDTLRSALSYIHHLNRILKENTGENSASIILPVRLTWPLVSTKPSAPNQQEQMRSDGHGFHSSDCQRKGLDNNRPFDQR